MLKALAASLILASSLMVVAVPANALQTIVTQIDRNADGSMTYHFAIKVDQGETLTPGEPTSTADFMTIYNPELSR